MVVIVPTNKSVEAFEGLHLYHGDISNCSMRVRMTLIEKGLVWDGHHLDLKKKENITDDYFGINPNGLVPTLIDNGVVHIESNDIIDYLDESSVIGRWTKMRQSLIHRIRKRSDLALFPSSFFGSSLVLILFSGAARSLPVFLDSA